MATRQTGNCLPVCSHSWPPWDVTVPLFVSPNPGSPLRVRGGCGHSLRQPPRGGPGGDSNRKLVAAGDAGGRPTPLAGGIPAAAGRPGLPGVPAARQSHGEWVGPTEGSGGGLGHQCTKGGDPEAESRGGRACTELWPAAHPAPPRQVPHRLLTLTLLPGLELCLLCGPRPPLGQLDPQVNSGRVPLPPITPSTRVSRPSSLLPSRPSALCSVPPRAAPPLSGCAPTTLTPGGLLFRSFAVRPGLAPSSVPLPSALVGPYPPRWPRPGPLTLPWPSPRPRPWQLLDRWWQPTLDSLRACLPLGPRALPAGFPLHTDILG